MMEDALVETKNKLIGENTYSNSANSATAPFAFGYGVDGEGRPYIGNGSDQKPLIVGISTKLLLSKFTLAAQRTLHIDATF